MGRKHTHTHTQHDNVCMYVRMYVWSSFIAEYRTCQSLGTPPRLTFQARLLHNQEDVNADSVTYGMDEPGTPEWSSR